ncbi:MAG: AbrB/MazE/SpoVT family DNA-binding domain-containing protein [Burkholderiales bacterium]|jgi:antitoxin PrlF
MATITLSSKGQLVIPKALRDRAELEPGARFSVQFIDGEIRLRPLARTPAVALDEVAGCLARPGRRRLSDEKLRAAILARLKARNAP